MVKPTDGNFYGLSPRLETMYSGESSQTRLPWCRSTSSQLVLTLPYMKWALLRRTGELSVRGGFKMIFFISSLGATRLIFFFSNNKIRRMSGFKQTFAGSHVRKSRHHHRNHHHDQLPMRGSGGSRSWGGNVWVSGWTEHSFWGKISWNSPTSEKRYGSQYNVEGNPEFFSRGQFWEVTFR